MDKTSITSIYTAFYLILHTVFDIFEIIRDLTIALSKRIIELCHELSSHHHHNGHHNHNRKLIQLQKIPQHVTVLLGPEEPSLNDLANLILWCMAAHITFVSFYDHKGTLNKHQDHLRQVVEERKATSDHIIWHSNVDGVYRNGFVGRKIHVKVLSGKEDGRGAVVDVVRQLAATDSGETDNDDEFNLVEAFEAGLRRRFEFPDPDLGLCCGQTLCMHGYPPWQMRVTEFLSIGTHHGFTFDMFVQLLHRYNKCEQRFGK